MAEEKDGIKKILGQLTDAGTVVEGITTLLTSSLDKTKNIINEIVSVTYEVYKVYEDFNDQVLSINKNFGGTLKSINKVNSYSNIMYETLSKSRDKMLQFGMDTETLASAINEISLKTGTMVGLSEEAAVNYAALSRQIGETNMRAISQDMMSIGYSIKSSAEFMGDVVASSHKLGLNSAAVTAQITSNFKSMSRMNFKDGAQGIAKMAKEAVMLGIDMGDVKRIADGLRKPEQAIEFSQKMQMLGGAFGSIFGDAFSVMKKARNDLPGLQKDIAKVASSMYKVSENGEFVMDGANIDILRQAAENFNMSLEDLQNMGERMAKTNYLKNSFSLKDMEDKDLNVLTGFVDFTKSKGTKLKLEGLDKLDDTMKQKIGIDDEGMVEASKINSELIEALKGTGKEAEKEDLNKKGIDAVKEQVKASINLTDQVSSLGKQFSTLLPDVAKIANQTDASKNLYKLVEDTRNLIQTPIKGKETAKDMFEKEATNLANEGVKKLTGVANTLLDGLGETLKKGNITIQDFFNIIEKAMKEFTKKEQGGIVKKYNNGGILNGPSHKDGGIPAYVKGSNSMLELEGGEAIINKKSTEMFKPYLSEINKKGGGIEFEKGGISKTNLDSLGSKMYSNINIGSSTPINVNVNVNGSLKLDNIEYQLTNEQKEEIMKTIGPKIMKDVNQQIGQGSYNTSGKPRKPENKFGF